MADLYEFVPLVDSGSYEVLGDFSCLRQSQGRGTCANSYWLG